MTDTLAGDVVRLTAHGRSYLIRNPGGRIGSKIAQGIPYEHKLLGDIYDRRLTGAAFDVGAHVGNHSLYLAAVCGLTVYAIEAQSATFAMLEQNIALNPELDIRPFNVAAGDQRGRGRFASRMQLKLNRGHTPVRRLDHLIPPVDLAVVKVDVEGMEPNVLAGMAGHLTRCHPVVYAETHTITADHKIGAVMEPLGYARTGRIAMGSVMVVWEHP